MKIAVIGGGIVGATTAFYLSRQDYHVTLIDDGTGQATKAAAGVISPWLSQRRNQDWYELAKQGAEFYPTLVADLGLPKNSPVYREVGTLLFKKNTALLEKLYQLAHKRKKDAPQIGDIRLLTAAEIKARIPLLDPPSEALFVSGGAKVNGLALIEQITQQFQAQGGHFIHAKVTGLQPVAGNWQLSWNQQQETFERVVLAAGAWLPQLLTPLGYAVDVRPQKGQLVEIVLPYATTDWPVVMPQGESDIIPFEDGRIFVGATHENDGEYDLTQDPTVLANLLSSVSQIAPEVGTAPITHALSGTRAYTSDFLPFFGTLDDAPGLYVASGLGSSGLTIGPIIAHSLVAWLNGEEALLKPAPYSPQPYILKH